MIKNRRSKPLAITLFVVLAMAILIACGGSGTTDSAKSSVPKPAPGSESPLLEAEAMTKVVESFADEQKAGTASAIALLIQAAGIQAAESQAAPVAEIITKAAERVVEEALKAATSDSQNLFEGIAKAMEAKEPLVEALLEAAEAMTKHLAGTPATVFDQIEFESPQALLDLFGNQGTQDFFGGDLFRNK